MLGENWGKFPAARSRLLNLITSSPVSNVFILSGDVHYAEISEVRCGERNLVEVTSSGMTHAWTDGGRVRATGYNLFQAVFPARYRRHRYDDQFGNLNIGDLKLSFDEDGGSANSIGRATFRILNVQGEPAIEREVSLRPKGFYADKQVAECEPYWGPIPYYQKMILWLFLATMLMVFVIIPMLTFVWFVFAAVLYVFINYENRRREQLEKKLHEQQKKRN